MIVSTEKYAPYGWPVFEDGTPIKQGDEVLDRNGAGFIAHIFSFNNGWNIGSGHGYGTSNAKGIFKRPTKTQMAEYYKKWPTEKKGRMTLTYTRNANGPSWATISYAANDGLDISDDVNHPKHYDNGKVECIDWIEDMLTPEEFRGYLKGAALKYQFRCENKGKPIEDLRKAQWYLKKLEELA